MCSNQWQNLTVKQHYIPAADSPEQQLSEHIIAIQLGEPLVMEGCLAGESWQKTTIGKDCLTITPAEATIQTRWHSTAEFLLIKIHPDLIQQAALELVNSDNLAIVPIWGKCDKQIFHIAWALKAEIEAGCLSGKLYGESLGFTLAVHLLHHYSTSTTKSIVPTRLSPSELNRVVDYIQSHLDKPIKHRRDCRNHSHELLLFYSLVQAINRINSLSICDAVSNRQSKTTFNKYSSINR